MGAWGYGILDNDNALDIEYLLLESIDLKKCESKKEFNQLENNQIILLKKYNDEKDYCKAEIYQVLGYMLITRGLLLYQETKENIIWGIDYELNTNCEYYDEPQERLDILNDFKNKIINYTNKPVEMVQTSLLDKIYKGLGY